jgi:hypothetical protein
MIGIIFDLTKAYDLLNHKILLEERYSYEIRGITNSWFLSYMSNRRQFKELNHSDARNIKQVHVLLCENKTWCATRISTWSIIVFVIYKWPSLNIHGENLVTYADNINVLITETDVGALQNTADQVIIVTIFVLIL